MVSAPLWKVIAPWIMFLSSSAFCIAGCWPAASAASVTLARVAVALVRKARRVNLSLQSMHILNAPKVIIFRQTTMERERMYRILRTCLYAISVRKRRSILSRGQTDDVLEYLREMALI